jgi:glycosyltransferase involved in cell wall biosynthesis
LEYPVGLRGGVSVLVENLIEGLAARGIEPVLVSPDTSETLRDSKVGALIDGHVVWNPIEVSAASSRRLARQIAESGVRVAHFHFGGVFGWGNRCLGRCPILHLDRWNVPCVSTVHLVVSLLEGYCAHSKPVWFKLFLLPAAWMAKLQQLRHVQREIAVSQHDFKKLQAWYWPFRDRFVQIYHSRLHAEPGASSPQPRGPVILNVGHVAWRKGQLVLAEAFGRIAARHPEWKLFLAGHDGGDGTIQQIRQFMESRRLTGRIELLGERNDALDLMRGASIYVQPSFWEALGLALQEAMFCGCAVIGSRAGGIPELIQHGRTGLLCESGNVAELSDALELLITDVKRREELGRAAAASVRARGMSNEGMIQRHIELYEDVAKPM